MILYVNHKNIIGLQCKKNNSRMNPRLLFFQILVWVHTSRILA